MNRKILLFLITSLAFLQGHAQENAEISGSYVTNGGWSKLTIATAKDGQITYEMLAMGGNGSTCEFCGKLQYVESKTALAAGKGKKCEIDFDVLNNAIEVTQPNSEQCRELVCGARATFEGTYNKVLAECDSDARDVSESEFSMLYDEGDFQGAFQVIKKVLSTCGGILNRQEMGRMKNELAITQYHLNDLAGCLKTLEPYLQDASLSDDEILHKYSYDAVFAGIQTEIAQAVRSTADLCRPPKN